MVTKQITGLIEINPRLSGAQIPAVGQIVLMAGDAGTSTNDEEEKDYADRLRDLCTSVATGHQLVRNTHKIATKLLPEAGQTFENNFDRRRHRRHMEQRAAELLIGMTPTTHHDHPHLRQARNILARTT